MPIRTCVGCQERDEQQNLVRWVAEASGRIKIDDARLPGRGAWSHRRRECLASAARGGFARSFRRRIRDVDVRQLWELVEDEESKA